MFNIFCIRIDRCQFVFHVLLRIYENKNMLVIVKACLQALSKAKFLKGFSAPVLYRCLHLMLKRSKVPLTKNGDVDGTRK